MVVFNYTYSSTPTF